MSRISIVALGVLAVLVLAACEEQEPSITLDEQVPAEMREDDEPAENDEPADDADVAATVEVTADELLFEGIPDSLPAGAIEFVMENVGNLPHDLVIEELGDQVVVSLTDSGETASGTVELEAGEYTLYCDVPGHRAGGMEETVTVE